MPGPIRQVIAVLGMPKEYLEQSKRADDIITASGASTLVTVPPANITAANSALKTFKNAPDTASRNAAFLPMKQSLQAIMVLFQLAANADPANAEVIILSGGFKVKKATFKQKQVFDVDNGVNSGTIVLIAEGTKAYACHDWMYSADGKNFTRLPPTMHAHTQVDGLTPGEYAYFTHELVTKDGGQGVSQVEKIMVK